MKNKREKKEVKAKRCEVVESERVVKRAKVCLDEPKVEKGYAIKDSAEDPKDKSLLIDASK